MFQENNSQKGNERIHQKLYWRMEFVNQELNSKNEK